MGKEEDSGYRAEIPDDALTQALESIENIERSKEKNRSPVPSEQDEEDELEAVVQVEIEDQDAQDDPQAAQLRIDLEKARREAAETHEKMLRVAADADNIRKRALKERDEAIRFGQEGLLRDLLPVADNLERTLAHVPPKGDDPALDALRQGVEMVLRQFLSIIDSHGVKPLESLGKPFDPKCHEALSREPTDEAEPGTVLTEMHRGYMLSDRLLRPALVTVACATDPEGDQAPGCRDGDQSAEQPESGPNAQPGNDDPDAGDADNADGPGPGETE